MSRVLALLLVLPIATGCAVGSRHTAMAGNGALFAAGLGALAISANADGCHDTASDEAWGGGCLVDGQRLLSVTGVIMVAAGAIGVAASWGRSSAEDASAPAREARAR